MTIKIGDRVRIITGSWELFSKWSLIDGNPTATVVGRVTASSLVKIKYEGRWGTSLGNIEIGEEGFIQERYIEPLNILDYLSEV